MRKLVLESGTWRYRVNEGYDDDSWKDFLTLDLITPGGRHVSVGREECDAMSVSVSGTHKRAITPGAIRRYIEWRIDEL